MTGDLTKAEQANVRAALNFLRNRCGGWDPLAKALRFKSLTLARVGRGAHSVSASMVLRVARLASASVDDVLTGRFPAPGTCPHCGHCPESSVAHPSTLPPGREP